MNEIRSRHRHPPEHGPEGKELPAEPHVSREQFFLGHLLRLERHARLAVEAIPIVAGQPAIPFHLVVKPGARQRRQHAHGNTINSHGFTSPQRVGEDFLAVGVKAKYHTRLHANAVFVDEPDGFRITSHLIEAFINAGQTCLGEGFQSDEQIDTAGLAGQSQQPFIGAAINADLRRPTPPQSA